MQGRQTLPNIRKLEFLGSRLKRGIYSKTSHVQLKLLHVGIIFQVSQGSLERLKGIPVQVYNHADIIYVDQSSQIYRINWRCATIR